MTSAVQKRPRKLPTSLTLTPFAKRKLEEMAAVKGISRSSIAEMAIREMYRKEKSG